MNYLQQRDPFENQLKTDVKLLLLFLRKRVWQRVYKIYDGFDTRQGKSAAVKGNGIKFSSAKEDYSRNSCKNDTEFEHVFTETENIFRRISSLKRRGIDLSVLPAVWRRNRYRDLHSYLNKDLRLVVLANCARLSLFTRQLNAEIEFRGTYIT